MAGGATLSRLILGLMERVYYYTLASRLSSQLPQAPAPNVPGQRAFECFRRAGEGVLVGEWLKENEERRDDGNDDKDDDDDDEILATSGSAPCTRAGLHVHRRRSASD